MTQCSMQRRSSRREAARSRSAQRAQGEAREAGASGRGRLFDQDLLALEDFVGVERSVTEEQFVFSEERGFYCFQQSPAAKLTCAGKDKGVPHPKVDQVVLDKLRSFYVERNAGLEELSGLRLGWLH